MQTKTKQKPNVVQVAYTELHMKYPHMPHADKLAILAVTERLETFKPFMMSALERGDYELVAAYGRAMSSYLSTLIGLFST